MKLYQVVAVGMVIAGSVLSCQNGREATLQECNPPALAITSNIGELVLIDENNDGNVEIIRMGTEIPLVTEQYFELHPREHGEYLEDHIKGRRPKYLMMNPEMENLASTTKGDLQTLYSKLTLQYQRINAHSVEEE